MMYPLWKYTRSNYLSIIVVSLFLKYIRDLNDVLCFHFLSSSVIISIMHFFFLYLLIFYSIICFHFDQLIHFRSSKLGKLVAGVFLRYQVIVFDVSICALVRVCVPFDWPHFCERGPISQRFYNCMIQILSNDILLFNVKCDQIRS